MVYVIRMAIVRFALAKLFQSIQAIVSVNECISSLSLFLSFSSKCINELNSVYHQQNQWNRLLPKAGLYPVKVVAFYRSVLVMCER